MWVGREDKKGEVEFPAFPCRTTSLNFVFSLDLLFF